MAAAYFLGPKLWTWALPPHEFAYGAPLASLEELPEMVAQFLALEALDPTKTRIEVSMLDGSSDADRFWEAYPNTNVQKNRALQRNVINTRPPRNRADAVVTSLPLPMVHSSDSACNGAGLACVQWSSESRSHYIGV